MKRLWLLLMFMACAAQRERGNGDFLGAVEVYRAPETERCAKYKAGGTRAAQCAEAKYLATEYVRRLSTGDEVCLEGGFGDAPGGACLSRAVVADTATNRVMLEVRQAKPDSRWYAHEQTQYWFEEGALVDLYLADHGY